jgi:hypothetical protein
MSIAMTVVVAPSRRLRFLLVGFGASLLAAACAVGCCASPGFTAGPAVALVLLFAGVCVMHAALRPAMVHRIDISGPGQLRLTVQQGVRPDKSEALPARLLSGSTLWPRLLLLRLETVGEGAAGPAASGLRGWLAGRVAGRRGRIWRVEVLPDSVPPEAFRALAVALGAGGGGAGPSSTGHKIL